MVICSQHSSLWVWRPLQNPSQWWPPWCCLLWHTRKSLFAVSAVDHILEASLTAPICILQGKWTCAQTWRKDFPEIAITCGLGQRAVLSPRTNGPVHLPLLVVYLLNWEHEWLMTTNIIWLAMQLFQWMSLDMHVPLGNAVHNLFLGK